MILIWFVLIGPLLLTGAALAWAASWRPELLFGVRVGRDYRDSAEAQRLLRRHRIAVSAATVAALFVSSASFAYHVVPGIGASPTLIAVAGLLSYRAGWSVARHHSIGPATLRVASLAPTTGSRLPGGALLWAGPFLILAAAILLLYIRWDELPSRIVVHWGLSGPDRWADKSWKSVFGILVIAVWAQVLLLVIALGITKGARRPVSASGWPARHRRINLLLLLAIGYVLAVMLANIAATPALGDRTNPPVNPLWCVGALLTVIAAACWNAFRHLDDPDDETDTTPDECWKWGEFYYNPNDAAAFVPKRSGFGYTVNFASPVSWVLGGITLLLPALIFLVAP